MSVFNLALNAGLEGPAPDDDALGSETNIYQVLDWSAFAAIHQSIMVQSLQARLFYVMHDAVLSAFQSAVSQLDDLSIGSAGISADASIYEKRLSLVQLRYQKILAKTADIIRINNQYHRLNAQLKVDSDTAVRSLNMVKTWGGLVGAIMMLIPGLDIAGAIVSGVASATAIAQAVREDDLKQDTYELVATSMLNHPTAQTEDSDAERNFLAYLGYNEIQHIESVHTYLEPESSAVQEIVTALFDDGTLSSTMSAGEALTQIHRYMIETVSYESDAEESWARVSQTIDSGSGDCEDLAFLEASLAIAALNRLESGLGSRSIQLSAGDTQSGPAGQRLEYMLVSAGYLDGSGRKIKDFLNIVFYLFFQTKIIKPCDWDLTMDSFSMINLVSLFLM